jgi:hypothetical protein
MNWRNVTVPDNCIPDEVELSITAGASRSFGTTVVKFSD